MKRSNPGPSSQLLWCQSFCESSSNRLFSRDWVTEMFATRLRALDIPGLRLPGSPDSAGCGMMAMEYGDDYASRKVRPDIPLYYTEAAIEISYFRRVRGKIQD
jgi:hypothetical protein